MAQNPQKGYYSTYFWGPGKGFARELLAVCCRSSIKAIEVDGFGGTLEGRTVDDIEPAVP